MYMYGFPEIYSAPPHLPPQRDYEVASNPTGDSYTHKICIFHAVWTLYYGNDGDGCGYDGDSI